MSHSAARLLAGLIVALLSATALAQPPAGDAQDPPPAPAAETPPEAPPADPPPAEAPPAEAPPAAAPAAAPPPAAPPPAAAPPAAAPGSTISQADQIRANRLWDEAERLYGQGRYKEAIDKFQQAHEILNKPGLLYSIALSYQQLESWQECVNYMDRFIEVAPTGPKKDRAATQRKNCKARIVRDQQLVVDSTPPGAKVYLDDKSKGIVGTTPFSTYVPPGAHVIWVELEGYQSIRQEIEVRVKEPFRFTAQLTQIKNVGWLHVDCTITDAQVYIDGKNIGLSPFREPLAYSAGRHQVVVTRDGYTRFDQHVTVEKGATTRVNAYLVRTEFVSSWRTGLGWTANIFGVLAVAGGVVSWQLAEEEFNDTDEFDQFQQFERLGYGIGGGLLLIGTSLIIWDRARDVILDQDRNPFYEQPVTPPGGAEPGVGRMPTRRAPIFGFTF